MRHRFSILWFLSALLVATPALAFDPPQMGDLFGTRSLGMGNAFRAVGTSNEADMFLTTAAAAPRSTWVSSPSGCGAAVLAFGCAWSLFGLLKALQAQNKVEQAKLVEADFKKVWADSDVTLTASRF